MSWFPPYWELLICPTRQKQQNHSSLQQWNNRRIQGGSLQKEIPFQRGVDWCCPTNYTHRWLVCWQDYCHRRIYSWFKGYCLLWSISVQRRFFPRDRKHQAFSTKAFCHHTNWNGRASWKSTQYYRADSSPLSRSMSSNTESRWSLTLALDNVRLHHIY